VGHVNGAHQLLFLNGENVYCLLHYNSLSCTGWNRSVHCRQRHCRTGVQVECQRSHGDDVGPCGSMTVVTGHMPGVLLQVTCLCRRDVAFRAHFAAGFLDCMMGGASVSRGMVMISAASITLCSASCFVCIVLTNLCHPLFY
jgi:hypothetical protein